MRGSKEQFATKLNDAYLVLFLLVPVVPKDRSAPIKSTGYYP